MLRRKFLEPQGVGTSPDDRCKVVMDLNESTRDDPVEIHAEGCLIRQLLERPLVATCLRCEKQLTLVNNVACVQHFGYSRLTPRRSTMAKSAHTMALNALVPASEREQFDRSVQALVARNRMLQIIEDSRVFEKISKHDLAEKAGLDPASVRRLLTAETANPTSETIVRLMSALDVKLEAVLPNGERLSII